MKIWQWARNLVGKAALGLATLAGLTVRIDDRNNNRGWDQITRAGSGPADRSWHELSEDLTDVLEAWRKNFLVRQIVRLTTAYVVGDQIEISSKLPEVNEFLQKFIHHPENHLDDRLPELCDELTRAGEVFPVLYTNKVDGMSAIRFTPASCITGIETAEGDYEKALGYRESVPGQLEPKIWKSKRTARVYARRMDNRQRRPEPVMLHYAINKVIGATRGESDLTPVLPWAKRYSEWLKDRVSFNRLRTELAAVDIEIENDNLVEQRQEYYRSNPPTGGGITVHGRGEKVSFPSANIQGFDAAPDGRALRLSVAASANIPLHFLGEGASATRSTATEMGDPTHRHYRMRQKAFCSFLRDLCECAWRRFEAVMGLEPIEDLQISVQAPDVSRADNASLAGAAKTIVETLAMMKNEGWVTDDIAVRLAFKFAGELLEKEDIDRILSSMEVDDDEQTQEQEPGEGGDGLAARRNGYKTEVLLSAADIAPTE